MSDAVCVVVFIMMALIFILGVIVGECLAIDKIADKRRSKIVLTNKKSNS